MERIRAFIVHPNWVRRGVGSMILDACEKAASAAGCTRFEVGATLTGVPLYRAKGYIALESLDVPLQNGESLAVIRMEKRMSFT
jgi:GNAT superfamily N-acetyltransferase